MSVSTIHSCSKDSSKASGVRRLKALMSYRTVSLHIIDFTPKNFDFMNLFPPASPCCVVVPRSECGRGVGSSRGWGQDRQEPTPGLRELQTVESKVLQGKAASVHRLCGFRLMELAKKGCLFLCSLHLFSLTLAYRMPWSHIFISFFFFDAFLGGCTRIFHPVLPLIPPSKDIPCKR